MEKLKDFRKSGTFKLSSGIEVAGELSLQAGATSLDLYSSTFFDTLKCVDIAGTLHDRSKVSLIRCITVSGPGWGYRGEEKYHFSSVFPHFVLMGDLGVRTIFAATINLAHALDMQVVLEGIETADQLETLQKLGCDLGQGYFFSPAKSVEKAAVWRSKPNTSNDKS